MAKHKMVQVFNVSWFGVGATEAATLMCISRDHANRIVDQLRQDFAAYPGHDPNICIDRTETKEMAA